MLTNQRILGLILILFIIGASTYFAISKFRTDVGEIGASPSPSASPSLTFVLDQLSAATPAPQPATGQAPSPSPKRSAQFTPTPFAQSQSQPSERPYFRNKYVGKFPGVLTEESLKNKKVVVLTNKGVFEIEIFPDTPLASSNFLLLAHNGFYDGLKFYKVEKDFVIYGGDPLGNGTGGPGYTFQDEAVTRDYTKGIIVSFNIGPNTNGSQFFIMLTDKPDLSKRYTIFGKVIKGMDVVEKLVPGDIMQMVTVQKLQ